MSIPAAGCARVALTFTHSLVPVKCEMTWALHDASGGIFADPSVTAGNVYTAALTHLRPALNTNVVMTGIVFEDVRASTYVGADFPGVLTAGTATAGGDDLPTDCCIAVKRSGAGLGRANRGRLYWPIWKTAWMVSPDVVGSAVITLIGAALVAFQVAVETGSTPCEMGIISTRLAGAPRAAGVFSRTLSWSVTDAIIDSQRRRLLGRGA